MDAGIKNSFMNLDLILYLVTAMIFWDFSIHLLELFNLHIKFLNHKSIFSYYYPHFSYMKSPNGFVQRPNSGKIYQKFWVSYWGFAFTILIIYLIFK